MRRLLAFLAPVINAAPVHALTMAQRPVETRRMRGGIHFRRIGGPHQPAGFRTYAAFGGVQAVRGFFLGRRAIGGVDLLLDGVMLRSAAVVPVPGDGRAAGRIKSVFNVWHDFSEVPPGIHRIAIRPHGLLNRLHTRKRWVMVEAPPASPPDSDAFIPLPCPADAPLDTTIAALPSVCHDTCRSPLPDPVRSILLLRVDQLGDFIVSVPAIRRMRQLFPDARLAILVTVANVDIARASGLFDAVVELDFPEAPGLGRRALTTEAQEALRERLRPYDFDLAVDLGEGAQSRLLMLLSGARFRYGFRHGDHAWLSAAFEFNARDPVNGHEVMAPSRKLLALVESLGALRLAPPEALPAPDYDPSRLRAYGLRPERRFVVLHTGARLMPSRWPYFAALARLLLDRTDLDLLLFTHGGASEQPGDLPPDQAARLHVIDGILPFEDFDLLLASCAVMVGNDSGPKHLAALRGSKVISLHMARLNWNEWGQEGAGLILSRRVPCAGCNVGEQPEECGRDYQCITGITAEEVYAAVMRLL